MCICPQGGGVSASVHAGIPPRSRHLPRADPPGADTPPDQAHTLQEQTPRADTPWSRHPTDQAHPPRADPPDQPHTPDQAPPPKEADCSIRLTSGRYASYWNAFLLHKDLSLTKATILHFLHMRSSCRHLTVGWLLYRSYGLAIIT